VCSGRNVVLMGNGAEAKENDMRKVPERSDEKTRHCANDRTPKGADQTSKPSHAVAWKDIA